jgi:hypothetical protein
LHGCGRSRLILSVGRKVSREATEPILEIDSNCAFLLDVIVEG